MNGRKISSQQTIVYLEEFERGFTMIWTIIFVVALVVSIVLHGIAKNSDIGWLYIVSFIVAFLSAISIIVALCRISMSHCAVDTTIAVNQMEHDSIVKEIEALEQDVDEKVSKVTVIKDVKEWNSDVYVIKYWSESPWTNWFYNKEVVDSLEYIEMEE